MLPLQPSPVELILRRGASSAHPERKMSSMASVDPSRYSVVRGLARGLKVLRALNERPPGGWSQTELADYLKIHRTTLKRILETLRELDYVALDADTGTYSLTPSIRSLASGFRDDNLLVGAAQRIMPELIEKLVWPVFLSIPERHGMVSRLEIFISTPWHFTARRWVIVFLFTQPRPDAPIYLRARLSNGVSFFAVIARRKCAMAPISN